MLTSFFGKSSPVNYLIIGMLIGIGYLAVHIFSLTPEFNVLNLIKHIFLTGLAVFMMMLVDFIVRKNNLTARNTYAIFIFAFFLLMVPVILQNGNMIVAVVFCLLAFRRIFSLTSDKNIEKKVLDASIWLALASFFYFYSILYVVVLYYAILRTPRVSFRHFFIPPLGLMAVFLLATAYQYMVNDSFGWFTGYLPEAEMDFSAYNSVKLLIPTTIILALAIWIGVYRILRISKVKRKQRPNYLILTLIMLGSFFIAFIGEVKDGSELLLTLPATAIAVTGFIEKREKVFSREISLWLIVLIPVGLLFI